MEPLTDNKACLPKSNDKLIFNVAIHVDIRSDYENYWKTNFNLFWNLSFLS